jgi:hypothetical protein
MKTITPCATPESCRIMVVFYGFHTATRFVMLYSRGTGRMMLDLTERPRVHPGFDAVRVSLYDVPMAMFYSVVSAVERLLKCQNCGGLRVIHRSESSPAEPCQNRAAEAAERSGGGALCSSPLLRRRRRRRHRVWRRAHAAQRGGMSRREALLVPRDMPSTP